VQNVWWILKRELGAYLRSPMGYVIIASVLVMDGLTFNALCLGVGSRRSTEVLEQFFFWSGGWACAASIFVAMRLIAEERQNGTLVLLATSPVRDWQIVLGKYLSGVAFLGILSATTVYMPALVFVHGKVALGHLIAGYLGVMLFASTGLAIGLLASALAPNQLVAAVTGAAAVGTFVLLWLLSKIASPPIETLLAYLSIHDKHFRPFQRGLVSVQDVLFYVSLIFVMLTLSTRVIEARRWR
jgi:ABC-2 type transport system permease protein